MERLLIRNDEVAEAKLREAISYIGENCPNVRELIEKRLKHIDFLGGPVFNGNLVIHNYRGESVIGEYQISVAKAADLSIADLADRICAAAIIVAAEEAARPLGSWILSGEEVELMVSYGMHIPATEISC
ncbi:MAG: hypothetical protein PHG66_03165 [Candidatus Colwellbacteria bacterium]|nr:hypothetical protein [Candidatus Colwellbacteria bacterium]